MALIEDLARQAQDALRVSSQSYRTGLRAEIFLARNEPGVQKILALAKDARAKALYEMARGTKEQFDARQATWKAWDDLVAIIEIGPKDTPRITGLADQAPPATSREGEV